MDLEDTLPVALPYVLTDGRVVAEVRYMTDEEFALANERACIATGSAWEWVLQTEGEKHGYSR